jgi:hypothetical protein
MAKKTARSKVREARRRAQIHTRIVQAVADDIERYLAELHYRDALRTIDQAIEGKAK